MEQETESPDELNQTNTVIINVAETEVIQFDSICRLCANQSERIIGIYSEEGIAHELAFKMNLYLPIKVSEEDTLPLQCCWNCASTVLAWHELVVGTVEADRRLREIQVIASKQILESVDEEPNKIQVITEYEPTSMKKELKDDSETEEIIGLGLEEECHSDHKSDYSVKLEPTNESKNKNSNNSKKSKWTKRRVKMKAKELKTIKEKFTVFCDICNRGYVTKYGMERHRQSKHFDNLDETNLPDNVNNTPPLEEQPKPANLNTQSLNRYSCDICHKKFALQSSIKRHKNVFHPDASTDVEKTDDQTPKIKSVMCHVCARSFKTGQSLNRHLREHHFGIKRYSCDVCDKKFGARAARDEHLNIHTNNRPFICDVCGNAFKQRASLRAHKLFHTELSRVHACELCDKKYRRAVDLKIHTWKQHTGFRPHKCDNCNAAFSTKYQLKLHLRIHGDSERCACDECGATFKLMKYLRNHKRNHRKKRLSEEASREKIFIIAGS